MKKRTIGIILVMLVISASLSVCVNAYNTQYIERNDSSEPETDDNMFNVAPLRVLIDGPTFGIRGEPLDFSFRCIDLDKDQVKYFINWGDYQDEETDYYPSGEEVHLWHTWKWDRHGVNFFVRAYAVDSRGKRSPPPDTVHYIYISLERNSELVMSMLFDKMIEKHPMLGRLFNLIKA